MLGCLFINNIFTQVSSAMQLAFCADVLWFRHLLGGRGGGESDELKRHLRRRLPCNLWSDIMSFTAQPWGDTKYPRLYHTDTHRIVNFWIFVSNVILISALNKPWRTALRRLRMPTCPGRCPDCLTPLTWCFHLVRATHHQRKNWPALQRR